MIPISSLTDSKVMLRAESIVPFDGITLFRPLKEFLTAEDKVFLFIFSLNLWSYFFSTNKRNLGSNTNEKLQTQQ